MNVKCFAHMSLLMLSSMAHADDVADVKAEFNKLIEYQKTDDDRILNLFSVDCSVQITTVEGSVQNTRSIPMDMFRRMLLRANRLKTGSRDKYENVKFGQDGDSIRVRATIVDGISGHRGPFLLRYVRGSDGLMKIKDFQVTTGK